MQKKEQPCRYRDIWKSTDSNNTTFITKGYEMELALVVLGWQYHI
jgi:hypothetical protein